MDEYLEGANKALFEGDREEVLRLLKNCPENAEVLWLRAHAARKDDERVELLEQVTSFHDDTFAPIAVNILQREHNFSAELAKPPDYQFWKKPTWTQRLDWISRNKSRVIPTMVFIVLMIFSFIVWGITAKTQDSQRSALAMVQTQTAVVILSATPEPPTSTTAPTLAPSVTVLPPNSQPLITYAAGQLSIVRYENRTKRPVTYEGVENGEQATPPSGADFYAVQLRFTCELGMCLESPEAQVDLRLKNGQTIVYSQGPRPVLMEPTPNPRIPSKTSIDLWYVFEVPSDSFPSVLLITTGSGDNVLVQELPWPQ